jgi:seryl-tRNA synthetase
VSSCSNFTDFRARSSKTRFQPFKGAKLEYMHVLNVSGLAPPRSVIAMPDNYQADTGTIIMPKVLRRYINTIMICGQRKDHDKNVKYFLFSNKKGSSD